MYKAGQPPPPFLEIPASMMEKMLDKTNEIGTIINDSINNIQKNKDKFRSELKDLINIDQTLINTDISTTCGIDGAYVVERLLGTDLLFSCALIIEGLFSKSQKESLSSAAANYDVFGLSFVLCQLLKIPFPILK